MTKRYPIHSLGDIHSIPPDRLDSSFAEMKFVLALNTLVFGDVDAKSMTDRGFEWFDDGNKSAAINDANGNTEFFLRVNKIGAA